MKIKILFVLFFLCGNLYVSYSQPIKTKDGQNIGNRSEFMTQCLSSGQTEINLNGIIMDLKSYCSCTCDRLIPEMNSRELMQAFQTGKTYELFLQDKYFKILTACFEKNYERNLGQEIEYKHHSKVFSSPEKQREFEINLCVKEVLNSPEGHYDTESAKVYCNCAIERLYKGGYSYQDIEQMDDLNSTMYNEIILPCSSLALEIDKSISESTNKKIVKSQHSRSYDQSKSYFNITIPHKFSMSCDDDCDYNTSDFAHYEISYKNTLNYITLSSYTLGRVPCSDINECYEEQLLKWEEFMNIKYKVQKNNWFVISGISKETDHIHYLKGYYGKNYFSTLKFDYPQNIKSEFDSYVSEISNSFVGN